MAISFDSLPQTAALFTIYSQAGRIFAEQVKNDPGTDYTQPKAFKDAIWFIAEKAKRRGFYGLQGMSTEEVASYIGNQIAAVASQAAPSFDSLPLNASLNPSGKPNTASIFINISSIILPHHFFSRTPVLFVLSPLIE